MGICCGSKDIVDGPVVAVKNETAASRPKEENCHFRIFKINLRLV